MSENIIELNCNYEFLDCYDYEKIKIILNRLPKQKSNAILYKLIEDQEAPHIFRLMILSDKFNFKNCISLLDLALEKVKTETKISLEFAKILIQYGNYQSNFLSAIFEKYIDVLCENALSIFFISDNFILVDNILKKIIDKDYPLFFNIAVKEKKLNPEQLIGDKSLLMLIIDLNSIKILHDVFKLKNYYPSLDHLRNYCEVTDNHKMLSELEKFV